MVKDKDRAINPAAAQRKLEKQKALKKGKAQVAAQRTARLAHRNPHRLESQIADLHALKESHGGKLSARDQKQLEELERDVSRVKKARESLGEQAPTLRVRGGREGARDSVGQRSGRGGRGGRSGYSGLGKRGRDDDREDESEPTDEDVRRIPWPKDTPPPVFRPERRQQQQKMSEGTSANREPLGAERYPGRNRTDGSTANHIPDTSLPHRPPTATVPTVTKTYESKAQVRDLRKEATSKFVPSAVKRKIDATRGIRGRLLEEEEVEKLEKEGYGQVKEGRDGVGLDDLVPAVVDIEGDEETRKLREEEEAFRRALGNETRKGEFMEDGKRAEVEEISDEDL